MRIFYRTIVGIFILLGIMAAAQAEPEAATNTNAAGQVVIVSGPFQALDNSHKARTLQRGDQFYTGETLITGVHGSAQIRFTDGTVTALNPSTQLKIESYEYQKKSESDKNIVSLVEGGFRTLTGLISKNNPNAYQVKTPVAVIGVRGTNYTAVLDKGHLYSGVWKGVINVKNDKGLLVLGEGQDYMYGVVNAKNEAPTGLLNPPQQLFHCGCCGGCDEYYHAPRTNL